MVYVNYEYYKKEYFGTLSEDLFKLSVVKASRIIDRNINTRLTEEKVNNLSEEAQDSLKDTACALIDLISKKQESDNKKLSSYSIDGVSKTFKTISDEEYSNSKKEIINCLPDELTKYL